MQSGDALTLWSWLRSIGEGVWEEHRNDLVYAAFVAAWGVMRLAGRTVDSGSVGLKFSFGRAVRVCEPGFYPLIPVLQTIRVVPSRSRTLALPPQQLTTEDGLVYHVDATLVYRVVDVRRALVEVDDLEQAMLQMLSIGVHSVLSRLERSQLRVSSELDHRLAEAMSARLEVWGVTVERAGFDAIAPSGETARLTQLAQRVRTRLAACVQLEQQGLSRSRALVLLGTSTRYLSRTRRMRSLEQRRRSERNMRALRARLSSELAVPATPAEWLQRRAEQRLADRKKWPR